MEVIADIDSDDLMQDFFGSDDNYDNVNLEELLKLQEAQTK